MVTQTYTQTFEHTLLSYTEQSTTYQIRYQENRLADQLVNHLVSDLVRDVISNPLEELRIQAARKLGIWGRDIMELRVLTRVSETDPNLELRAAAADAVEQIRSRLA
ncbi:MAG: hypothetical protein ACXAE3_06530 [Candidatus Kariarchaeaceae archaeon]|jgi:hypothetical protein